MQIGPLKREVPGPAGRSLGPLFPGAQSLIEEKEVNDPPVTPKPVIPKNEDNIFLKTTSKYLVLKPPSTQQKPGVKQTRSRKRMLPETAPANQKKISSKPLSRK